jgi:hypothetical protein
MIMSANVQLLHFVVASHTKRTGLPVVPLVCAMVSPGDLDFAGFDVCYLEDIELVVPE